LQSLRAVSVSVKVTTLDEFFEQQGWPLIHLMKVDVEGGEYAVLNGMEELCQRNRCLRVIVEFSPPNLSTAGVAPEHLLQRLRNLGFSRLSIISSEFEPVEPLGESNLFENSDETLRRVSGANSINANLLCEKEASRWTA
jgi:hypothetical protein